MDINDGFSSKLCLIARRGFLTMGTVYHPQGLMTMMMGASHNPCRDHDTCSRRSFGSFGLSENADWPPMVEPPTGPAPQRLGSLWSPRCSRAWWCSSPGRYHPKWIHPIGRRPKTQKPCTSWTTMGNYPFLDDLWWFTFPKTWIATGSPFLGEVNLAPSPRAPRALWSRPTCKTRLMSCVAVGSMVGK